MNPTDFSELPLRDIQLPAAVSWWPPAVGWWLVLGLLGSAALAVAWRYRSLYRERAALNSLKAVAAELAGGGSPAACVQRISMTLRRFAMSVADQRSVAGLTGDSWLGFLDSRWGRDEFSAGAGRVLVFAPYAPPERIRADDVGALNQLCIAWIRAQRPKAS
jgi:hypothetical protein